MKDNIRFLFDSRYSKEKLISARENVKKEGKTKAEELFKQFGLEKLDQI
jgi:hypothetical protein